VYDALLVSVEPAEFSSSVLFGDRLRCRSVTVDEYIDCPADKWRAHCVVLCTVAPPSFEAGAPSQEKVEAVKSKAGAMLIEASRTTPHETTLRRIVACCVEKDNIVAAVEARVKKDATAGRPSIEDDWAIEACKDPENGVWKVTVRARLKAPSVPQGTEEEEEAVRGPSWEQAKVAEALLRRTRAMLGGEAFDKFADMQFLILVPNFTTLLTQTAYRVRRAKLTERGKNDEYAKVITNCLQGNSPTRFEDFKDMALKGEDRATTLFVIIADECHFGPTRVWGPPQPSPPPSSTDMPLLTYHRRARNRCTSTTRSCASYQTLSSSSTRPRRSTASPPSRASPTWTSSGATLFRSGLTTCPSPT